MNKKSPLSNIDINHYYKDNPHYGGCFRMIDFKKPQQGMFYFIDMSKPGHAMGHWVMLSLLNPKEIKYYDAFGVPPSMGLVRIVRGNSSTPRIWYNDIKEESLTGSNCGQLCCKFVDHQLKDLGHRPAKTKPKKVELGSGLPIDLFAHLVKK